MLWFYDICYWFFDIMITAISAYDIMATAASASSAISVKKFAVFVVWFSSLYSAFVAVYI